MNQNNAFFHWPDQAWRISESLTIMSNGSIILDGYKVPFLRAYVSTDAECISIGIFRSGETESHMHFDIPYDAAGPAIYLAATAMACASGYSCFGKNSVSRPNPFQVQVGQL